MTATTATTKALEYVGRTNRYSNPRIIAVAEAGNHELALVEVDYSYGTDEAPRTAVTRILVDGNGRTSTGVKGDEKAATAKLVKYVTTSAADDVLRPQLTALVRNADGRDGVEALTETPAVGDVVYVYAMGRNRRGIVTKLTKTKAEVAFTTASSGGRIFRKADTFASLDRDVTPATAPAPAAEEAPITAREAAPLEVCAACGTTDCPLGLIACPVTYPAPAVTGEDAVTVPTRDEVARYTDEQLETSEDALELAEQAAEEAGLDDLAARIGKARQHVEQEQDARELWNSPDARVRESVGNYRP